MSELNFNFKAPESVFKVPNLPSKYRKTCNNTQSTYNNEGVLQNVENTYNIFKKVEERYEVLKKICPPEDVTKILNETVDRLTEACYEKMAEQLVRPSNSQAFSSGGSSVYSLNTRPVVPIPSVSSYGTSISNIQEPPFESTRRKINSTATSKNRYGLLNAPIPDRPSNLLSEPCSRVSNVIHEEPPVTILPIKTSRSKKRTTTDLIERGDPATGLSIPLRIERPNLSVNQSKRSSKKQSPGNKELEIIPSEDENDSLSVFFRKGRTVTSKQPINDRAKKKDQSKESTKSQDLSITLNRIHVNNVNESATGLSRKRKASQNDNVPSRKKSPVTSQKETRTSPDTTTSNITVRKSSKATNNESIRKSKRNVSIVSTKKPQSTLKAKKNKENEDKPKSTTVKSKPQKERKNPKTNTGPVASQDVKLNTNDAEEMFDNASFFGDVSSIVGTDSVLANTIAKNSTKHSTENRNDMPSHFFSPFANFRSTSGVSAVSTPLSKTLTKNILGKRVKKPSVVAEFKNAQIRNARKANTKTTEVAPVPENVSESSESDNEISDFSS